MPRNKRLRTGQLETRSPGKTIRTSRTREAFLDQLRRGRSVQGACDEVEISRSAAYKWYREDKEFAEEWDDAIEGGTDRLEDEAQRRGARGVRKQVWHNGKVVGFERVYSDRLLEGMLGARRPGKWRGKTQIEMGGPNGGPIQTQVVPLSLEEIKALAAERGLPTEIFEK